jgi:hypothetical protein
VFPPPREFPEGLKSFFAYPPADKDRFIGVKIQDRRGVLIAATDGRFVNRGPIEILQSLPGALLVRTVDEHVNDRAPTDLGAFGDRVNTHPNCQNKDIPGQSPGKGLFRLEETCVNGTRPSEIAALHDGHRSVHENDVTITPRHSFENSFFEYYCFDSRRMTKRTRNGSPSRLNIADDRIVS